MAGSRCILLDVYRIDLLHVLRSQEAWLQHGHLHVEHHFIRGMRHVLFYVVHDLP